MIVGELLAIAIASIVAGAIAWGGARRRRRLREQERLSDPYQAARDQWIKTGDVTDLMEMLRHLPRGE